MEHEVYCEIVGSETSQGLIKKKVVIEVDLGQDKGFLKRLIGDPLKDPETGKVIQFNSMIDALNYMSKQGWSFVNAYAVTKGKDLVYHYIMKKIVA